MEKNDDICKEAVFQRVYNDLNKEVWRFIYYKCGDSAQADDLVQDAFIKLWQNCGKTPIGKAKSFLYTITMNAFLNQIAHKKVVLKYSKLKPTGIDNESPEHVLEQKEFNDKIQASIANLTDGQRTAFLLNRIEGKKYTEIAELLNLSVKAVEKRMSLALKTLIKEIGDI
jgi:RNA polymerase sigma-70 factor (ECF subfamily)